MVINFNEAFSQAQTLVAREGLTVHCSQHFRDAVTSFTNREMVLVNYASATVLEFSKRRRVIRGVEAENGGFNRVRGTITIRIEKPVHNQVRRLKLHRITRTHE